MTFVRDEGMECCACGKTRVTLAYVSVDKGWCDGLSSCARHQRDSPPSENELST